jgi:hypothetical protein
MMIPLVLGERIEHPHIINPPSVVALTALISPAPKNE